MITTEELEEEFKKTITIPDALRVVYRTKLYGQQPGLIGKAFSASAKRMMKTIYDECYTPSEKVTDVNGKQVMVHRDPKPRPHELGGGSARKVLDLVDEGMFLINQ